MALTLVTSDLILGLDYGKLTGTIPTWNQNTTGNADTATLAAGATILATARNIGGVSFNGSAAINLPGVNTAGNQNTSGVAATATLLATARNINSVAFDGSADITIVDTTKLPLAGGTLTGALSGTSATFSGSVNINGGLNPDLDVKGTVIIRGNSSAYSTHYFTTAAANVATYQMLDASGNIKNSFSAGGDNYITGGNVGIGTDSIPSDHKLQIHSALAYSRFALSNSTSGSASGDGLKFQLENLNAIIKNQENGYLTFGTNGRETDFTISSGGAATFNSSVTAVNISNNGIYYGRANASYPTTSLGYFVLKTNNIDAERGGLTVQVSNSISTFIDALTINYGGVLQAKYGISFTTPSPASSGTPNASSILNAYEEGTWTPQVGGAVSGTATYSVQTGTYIRIGKQVTVTWQVDFQKSTMSGGTLQLLNLPYASAASAHFPEAALLLDNVATFLYNPLIQFASSSTVADFIGNNGSTITHVGLPINTYIGGGTLVCRGTGTYFLP